MATPQVAPAGNQAAYERVAVSSSPAPRPSYRSVFAVAEFRALWLSYVLSAGGDRLALVAMTLLVYARSKSPLLAAITFASGFVPYLLGGLFLSGLADRLPRRTRHGRLRRGPRPARRRDAAAPA